MDNILFLMFISFLFSYAVSWIFGFNEKEPSTNPYD